MDPPTTPVDAVDAVAPMPRAVDRAPRYSERLQVLMRRADARLVPDVIGGTNGRCGGSASVMDGISMQSSRDEFVGMNDLDLLKEGDLPIGTIEHHH